MKTTKVRMLTIWASAHGCFGPGQCVELPEDLANDLIKARSAEPVGGAAKPRAVTGTTPHQAPPAASTATNDARETADADPHKGRVKLVRDPEAEPDPEDELPEEDDDELEEEDELDEDELPEDDDEADEADSDTKPSEPAADPLSAIPEEPSTASTNKAPNAGRSRAKKSGTKKG